MISSKLLAVYVWFLFRSSTQHLLIFATLAAILMSLAGAHVLGAVVVSAILTLYTRYFFVAD